MVRIVCRNINCEKNSAYKPEMSFDDYQQAKKTYGECQAESFEISACSTEQRKDLTIKTTMEEGENEQKPCSE